MSEAMGIIAAAIAKKGGAPHGKKPYYAAGSVTFENLPTPTKTLDGATYNVTDAFTSDSRFADGSGIDYPAGTDVVIFNAGTEESPNWKYNIYAGGYVTDSELSTVSENPVQNKVVTAAITNTQIMGSASGADISITDSADADVQGVRVYGRSEVVEGEIVSVGDSGSLTLTTSNSDSTKTSVATLTTGLPLYGIPVSSDETYTDEQGNKWYADSMSVDGVINRCYKIVLTGGEDWKVNPNSATGESGSKRIYCDISVPLPKSYGSDVVAPLICDVLTPAAPNTIYNEDIDNVVMIINYQNNFARVYIRVSGISTADGLKTYLASNPVILIYQLKTPTTTPLTTAEKSALLNLHTYDSTINLSITDSPYADVDYLKNTDNGKAVAQEEANTNSKLNLLDTAHLALIADDYDSTATYAQGDYCIYNGKLYKCTTTVSTAEAFDPEKWTATTIMAEIEGG